MIRKRIFDILAARRPSAILEKEAGELIPPIRLCIGFPGGKNHGETVFEHLLMACDAVSPKYPLIRLAALLHDIGKPIVFRKGAFFGHEEKSGEIAAAWMRTSGFAREEIEFTLALIASHMLRVTNMRPGRLKTKLARLMEAGPAPKDFLRLRFADRLANLRRPFSLVERKELVKSVQLAMTHEESCKNQEKPPISGFDVMSVLGIGPGPDVGRIRDMALSRGGDRGEMLDYLASLANNPTPGLRL